MIGDTAVPAVVLATGAALLQDQNRIEIVQPQRFRQSRPPSTRRRSTLTRRVVSEVTDIPQQTSRNSAVICSAIFTSRTFAKEDPCQLPHFPRLD